MKGGTVAPMRALAADRVTVAFPGTKALDRVTLHLKSGSVHSLVGQNGAGKSTLIKVLAGVQEPNEGTVSIDGSPVALRRPIDAVRAGIHLVPQELQLFEHLPVWENVAAPMVATTRGTVRYRVLRGRADEALRQFGDDIGPDRLACDLTAAQRQRVLIARAMAEKSRFLILDEPTAVLSRDERSRLIELIRRVSAEDVGVLFVSHHLEEALTVGDEVTVLRDGRIVWTRSRLEVDELSLKAAMFGAAMPSPGTQRSGRLAPGPGRPLLAGHGVKWPGARFSLDFELHAGQIVGVAGLPGSGADTLNAALLGDTSRYGEVEVDGKAIRRQVGDAFSKGVGYIPADRKTEGLFAIMSVAENICAASLRGRRHAGFVTQRSFVGTAQRFIADLGIATAGPLAPVATLSGGNQQKVIVGRWLAAVARVLLANEPTRGVDAQTRVQIYEHLRRFADRGGACLVYSSDLLELVDLCQDIIVLRREDRPVRVGADVLPDDLYAVMSGNDPSNGERT